MLTLMDGNGSIKVVENMVTDWEEWVSKQSARVASALLFYG